ncbi:hypothetical protein HMPREF2130_10880 [Oligella urethralis DNF00040]|uniref:Uncharacterized protein n=2 Tax=Oligella urethralis TaxID=90245 RepID=A0A095YTD4_9BURK|nr:hypothetical protein HMPREF2130_10880 [Oligella urethralis DNF00040]
MYLISQKARIFMKKTTNAQTEHSKKLRGDTANKHNATAIAEGKRKRLSYLGKTELVDETRERIKSLSENQGVSGLETISRLLDFYDKHNNA